MKSKALILSLFLALPLFGNLNADLESVPSLWEDPDYVTSNVLSEMVNDCTPTEIHSNKKGEVVWSEWKSPTFFYWNECVGIQIVDISDDLMRLGFELRESGTVYPIHLDENGNVFIRVIHNTTQGFNKGIWSESQVKLCVWNKEHGFRLIHTSELDSINKVIFNDKVIVVTGTFGPNCKHKIVVIQNQMTTQEAEEPEEEQPFWKRWWPFTCHIKE